MTAQPLTAYLDALERTAHEVSAAEESYRREAAVRFRELEQQRAFAFRRLNLMRTVAAAVAGIEEEAEAQAAGGAAFLRELDWTGATESQRQTLEQFRPVILAAWRLSRAQAEGAESGAAADGAAADDVTLARALAAFEEWFAGARNGAFLTVMEREIVELPLVEV